MPRMTPQRREWDEGRSGCLGRGQTYMKIAPIWVAMGASGSAFEPVLVHTGQHYDDRMSSQFFRDLELPPPNEFLNVGSGTHAEQTARVMLAFEPLLINRRPDRVLVAGESTPRRLAPW
jgi:UDP-N-acetylglucosamine 2-epimerase (non-hydrolysing)